MHSRLSEEKRFLYKNQMIRPACTQAPQVEKSCYSAHRHGKHKYRDDQMFKTSYNDFNRVTNVHMYILALRGGKCTGAQGLTK